MQWSRLSARIQKDEDNSRRFGRRTNVPFLPRHGVARLVGVVVLLEDHALNFFLCSERQLGILV